MRSRFVRYAILAAYDTAQNRNFLEVAGVEPASRKPSLMTSTSLADCLSLALGTLIGLLPLSHSPVSYGVEPGDPVHCYTSIRRFIHLAGVGGETSRR